MKKKFLIAGITCSFLLISGLCYSCSYQDRKTSAVLVDSLTNEETEKLSENDPVGEENSIDNATSTEILQAEKTIDNTTLIEDDNANVSSKNTSEEVVSAIYIHICGAVEKPGVYSVENGARIFDLIELSGGLSKQAAGDYINQAQQVTDGQRIYIPTKEEVKELSAAEYLAGDQGSNDMSAKDQSTSIGGVTIEQININTATAEELMELPGIGQAKADSIISYRTTNGKFQAIEELMDIPGIKEGLFGKISAYIIVK